jgi:hypothetical protein
MWAKKAALISNVPHQVGTLKSGISSAAFSVLREAPFASSKNEVRLYTFLRLLSGKQQVLELFDWPLWADKQFDLRMSVTSPKIRDRIYNMNIYFGVVHWEIGQLDYGFETWTIRCIVGVESKPIMQDNHLSSPGEDVLAM